MTDEPREQARLRYIRHSIGRIEEYTRGGRQVFRREPIVQDAVLRRLETVADAVGKLSDVLKARYPKIPWRQAYGFRNIAAHAYEEFDLVRVWEIVDDYLPMLKSMADRELGERRAIPSRGVDCVGLKGHPQLLTYDTEDNG